jgi:hypothetical protein
MRAFFEGLATYCSSVYNTQVNSTVLIPGQNFVAVDIPDEPNFLVGFIPVGGARDPHSVLKKPEFALIVRTPRRDSGRAAQLITDLSSILGSAENPVPSHPAIVRSISEPAMSMKDVKDRIVMVTKFVVWSVSL